MANKVIKNVGIHHIALAVSDYEKSIKFYTEGLGFQKVAEWGEGTGRIALLDIGNGQHFEIFANGKPEAQANEKFWHLAIATTDPDGAYNAAIAAGATCHIAPKDVDIQAKPEILPVRLAFVKGFDGEVIEFFKCK